MAKSESEKVADFLADIQSQFPEEYEIFIQVRDLFLDNDPSLATDVKYGGMVFFKGKELISGIFLYKNHISIEFGYGARWSDPYSVLEGKGKLRRHIKIVEPDDIKTKKVAHYVHEAVVYKSD